MSLLLDALKKAAEQKAEKSRQEAQVPDSKDETVVTSVSDDGTMFEAGADSTAQTVPRGLNDQTHIDATEMQTRVDATHSESEEVDATEMQTRVETTHIESEEHDATEMQTRVETTHFESEEHDATEMQTRVETTQFDNDEVDATEMQTRVDSAEIDDTDLEYTGSTQTQSGAPGEQMQSAEDETTILDNEDVSDFLEDTEFGKRDPEDETELTQPALDDTDLNDVSLQGNTVGSAGTRADEDDTDISRPFKAGDRAEPIDDGQTEVDVTEADDDEDMSLLLVDHDESNLTADKEITGQPVSPDNMSETEFGDADTEGLALVDKTPHQPSEDATEISVPTRSSVTVTTGTATQTQGLASPMETTSTRTYAPDNYDRTLMKLPSDDASKIFAGMKSSDNDVVMTPDYAKKVFRSKSTAQRMQSVKVYTGIVLVILLSIGVFGTFEFQQQSSDIETSLRPLKRDPMPGIIQPDKPEADADLFNETNVDSRTLEIIESAGSTEVEEVEQEVIEAEEIAVVNEGVIVAQTEVTEEAGVVETVAAEEDAIAPNESADAEQKAPDVPAQTVDNSQAQSMAAEPEGEKASLEIISSSQIEQKDLWLREAYAAYKTGDVSLAMTRYNQVLEVNPTNRNALLARAAINVQGSNSDAAIRDYRTLLLQNPKDSLAMTSLIAVANLSPVETESQLKLMIRDEPDSPYLNFALANAYGAQQRWQEAQGYYFRALENNPGDPNYAYNLAVSLEHISQPQAAIVYYRRALDNIGNSLATFNRDIVSQRVEMLAKK